ncbi:high-affinity branched-chain amino acid ABC transporter ATP-binding protein LivG [Picosynechococcus sp. PCC 7003]|uniref:ABC transporter ATP-binding protein n=1 Tax=Picosynechococcus sp. PCC 7003 TaxID=374981 RepID=UPI0008106188|nr:ABC transporter ATP-binding protein [Picosynechococcus sp. PCC 7003]ANV84438.1 high-affinity branched-chain amino acid ABC transporter ATP-binding protein LivG [Picosynechococcus sp. PCC 7003]
MPDLATPILNVQHLTRRFGGLVAVHDVSFQVTPGEIFGLIGPNGAGKTTFFNMLTGMISPSQGSILYQGRGIHGLAPHQIAASGIARTFQNLRLFGNLSALENVAIARHLHQKNNIFEGIFGLPKAKKAEQETYDRAKELLDLVGLAGKYRQQAKNFSYGDQRRLEIARALALEPQLLLLDEPAAGMNPNEKGALSDLIRQIRAQFDLTILLIEHHIPLVMGLCDRLAVLDFGELIALGLPEVVKADPAVIEAYLGDE